MAAERKVVAIQHVAAEPPNAIGTTLNDSALPEQRRPGARDELV
jgi:hypothetical protein